MGARTVGMHQVTPHAYYRYIEMLRTLNMLTSVQALFEPRLLTRIKSLNWRLAKQDSIELGQVAQCKSAKSQYCIHTDGTRQQSNQSMEIPVLMRRCCKQTYSLSHNLHTAKVSTGAHLLTTLTNLNAIKMYFSTAKIENQPMKTKASAANKEKRQRPLSVVPALSALGKKISRTVSGSSGEDDGSVPATIRRIYQLDDTRKMITMQLARNFRKQAFAQGEFVKVQRDDAEPCTCHVVSSNANIRTVNIIVQEEDNLKSMATYLYLQAQIGTIVTLV